MWFSHDYLFPINYQGFRKVHMNINKNIRMCIFSYLTPLLKIKKKERLAAHQSRSPEREGLLNWNKGRTICNNMWPEKAGVQRNFMPNCTTPSDMHQHNLSFKWVCFEEKMNKFSCSAKSLTKRMALWLCLHLIWDCCFGTRHIKCDIRCNAM